MRHLRIQILLLISLQIAQYFANPCIDFYLYKQNIERQNGFKESQSDYIRNSRAKTRDEIPQKDGTLIIPFLSKSQILKLRSVDLSNQDVDEEFYDRGNQGVTDYDYVVPVCFNNQTFVLKLDFSTTLIYVAGVDLEQESIRKYMATYSLTHDKGRKYLNLQDALLAFSMFEYHQLSSYSDQKLNYSFQGDYILENVEVVYTQASQNLNSQKSQKNDDKHIVGLVKIQNHPYINKNINGLFGLGSQHLDNSYQESFLNKIKLGLNGRVFSICLNGPQESGGYLIIGGYDMQIMDIEHKITWIRFSKVNQYMSFANSIRFGDKVIQSKQISYYQLFRANIIFETKTPYILVSENFLNNFQREFIDKVCERTKFKQIKEFCNIDSHILRGHRLNLSSSDFDLIENLPQLSLDFNRDGVHFYVNNYITRCINIDPRSKSNEFCSLIRIQNLYDPNEIEMITIGSQVIRNYYTIIDNQLSRIGFSNKRNQFCSPEKSDFIIPINDNNQLRLGINCCFLIMILVIAGKSTSGCVQFFDFGSQSGSASSNQQQNDQISNNNGDEQTIPHDNFQDESSQLDEDSISGNSASHRQSQVHQRQPAQQVNQRNGSVAVAGERHQTHTFRSDEKSEFH
ncbi:UNKNOWN [Stylonychia lemnae]|uniref:Peptidase A1 domain-containing protein n=1 Tax=Stylonychia lemnae TaxID=5949 RepID=A0A078A556_STYLE|nr:UNKNOWN [Stylonychia lemnae]|eukprot:CDW76715.1 UNKNOWN [Stylonychia lemnae]